MQVVGIGQCCLDYLALIDTYPEVDTKNEVIEWHEQSGGPVATALITLSRLGVKCRFHGITGDDFAADKIKEALINENINVHGLLKREKNVSHIALIVIEKGSAKRTVFWKRPSGEPLSAKELGHDFLTEANFLILDGLMKDASLYAAQRARELNIPVMLDAGRARPGMLEVSMLSDYVVASQDFAKDMGWELTQNGLNEQRKKLGCKVLAITFGEKGSLNVSGDEFFQIPAFYVDAIDTTGAGDVFHGGYIYGLLKAWSLRDTVVFASALAAMKCRKIGAQTGIPSFIEASDFLIERGYSFL